MDVSTPFLMGSRLAAAAEAAKAVTVEAMRVLRVIKYRGS
jgi:hypothetical protein